MTTGNPRICVGVMVYNGALTLRRALDSLARQRFDDCEFFISDDASSDSSPEICREYCEKEPRFKYQRQDHNIGLIDNFKYVLDNTRSDCFTWLGQDDYYENSDYLAKLYSGIQEGYDLVFPQIKKFYLMDNRIINLRPRIAGIGNVESNFKKHIHLMRRGYLGYQLLYGLSRREILRDINLWLKSYYVNNVPDEEPLLHFLLSRYTFACMTDVYYVKDMTSSHYFRLSFRQQFMPMILDFVAVAGILAQCQYTNWQKIQLISMKLARCAFTLGDIFIRDLFRR